MIRDRDTSSIKRIQTGEVLRAFDLFSIGHFDGRRDRRMSGG